MPKQYETSDPAADPLPGPTRISCVFAYLTKSNTIKKIMIEPHAMNDI